MCEVLLPLWGDASGEFLQRQSCIGKYLTIFVDHVIPCDVILHNLEITHVQRLENHVVDVGRFTCGSSDVSVNQSVEQVENDEHGYDGCDNVHSRRNALPLYAFRVEPAVLDVFQFTALLET